MDLDAIRTSEAVVKEQVRIKLRASGMTLNPSSIIDDPDDPCNVIDVCDFCKRALSKKKITVELGALSYPEWQTEPCGCPENIENTAKYNEAFQTTAAPLLAEAKRQRVARLFESSRLPTRWRTRAFDHFTVTPANQNAYDRALQYVDEFNPEIGEGLLFTGTVGTGKTHLAAAVAMALMERENKVIFGTISTLLSEIRYSYNDEAADSEAELFERYTTCDLLVIDDLGKERVSEWVEGLVFDIVNTRYENNRALVITTNLGLKEIKAKYRDNGEALVDRLLEMCRGIKLEGESWRRKAIG